MGFSIQIVKESGGKISWVALAGGKALRLPTDASSLQELLLENVPALVAKAKEPVSGAEVLSPVTAPCQIICQGKNYLDHLIETGVKPQNKDYNLLFTKADSSLAPPFGPLKRPKEVRLLDYEVELGLVIGREIKEEISVGEQELGHYVAALVLANDVSARDVQVPERQWFRGKSFRGFCPVGPLLYWMEPQDWKHFYSLELQLSVNGEVRQKATTAQLMHRPPETLSLISRTFDLRPGDLLLTGTPGGVSMKVKPKSYEEEVADLKLTDREKMQRFVENQAANGRYLKDGDRIEASIRTSTGEIDLGAQLLEVQG